MKNFGKRFLALALAFVLAMSQLPAMPAAAQARELTDADYAAQEALFAQIDKLEDAYAKKNSSQESISDAAERLVLASDNYVEGSLVRNGDAFTWMTVQGIRCGYSPRMEKIRDEMVAPENPEPAGVFNEPVATKGGSPTGKQVYLVAPFYGLDDSFTDQYKNEAKAIASAIGDTDGYTLYSGSSATIANVAKAISNGAVVIFDSHGDTDYYKKTGKTDVWGDPVYDCVTQATNSYLCLSTRSGLTDADYDDGAIWSNGMAYVNGAVIANHMTKNSPSGILWMAICLGMATNTLCQPMRDMGVEVVYGYSQSVTFAGDYCYEEVFWDEMCSGSTVAAAVSEMKSQYGNWDWSTQIAKYYGYSNGYSTIAAARTYYIAFPVVVSDEDAHPGQRTGNSNYGACSLQTVKSTYTIFGEGGSGDVTEPADPPETDAPQLVTSPKTDTAYKLGLETGGEIWYFTGYTESASVSYRLETSNDISDAVDVYLEQASSGYYMYFMNGSTKTYIRLFHYKDASAGQGKGSIALVTSKPSEVYQYDTAANTVVYKYDNNNSYYMGAYNSYTAISASNTSYITGSNAGNIGVTQYPVRFYQEKNDSCSHVYDNAEDTSCNSCGYVRTVSGIAIATMPAQQQISLGGTLDVTGGSIRITYSDGSTGDVAMNASMVTGFNNQQPGQQTLTVTYGGCTATYTVTVVEPAPDGLGILTMPNKIDYLTGEQIDLTGLTLLAIFGDELKEIPASEVIMDPVDMSTPGIKTVAIYYRNIPIGFTIYVHQLQALTIDSSLYPESIHNYTANMNDTQTLTYPGAASLTLTFSGSSYTELGYDFVYILDGAGQEIAKYTGNLSGKTVTVSGDTVQVKLTTDGTTNKYGYAFSSIVAQVVEHPGDLQCEICGQFQATAGQTVVLTEDAVVSDLTIPYGVTVDLNGHILLADYLVSFGQIIDTAGSGELWTENLEMVGNDWLPIAYESGCYRFYQYEIQSLGSKTASGKTAFGFSLDFVNAEAYDLLWQTTDVQIAVSLQVGNSTQIYAFSEDLVMEYVILQSKYPQLQPCMILNVTGMDAAEAGTVISVTPTVTAVDGQVLKTGTTMTYTA